LRNTWLFPGVSRKLLLFSQILETRRYLGFGGKNVDLLFFFLSGLGQKTGDETQRFQKVSDFICLFSTFSLKKTHESRFFVFVPRGKVPGTDRLGSSPDVLGVGERPFLKPIIFSRGEAWARI